MAIPAFIAISALKLGWELGKQFAKTPAGQHLIRQGADLTKSVFASKSFQDGVSHAGGQAMTAGFQRMGLGPNGAQVASKVVTDVVLKGPDGKLRPEVATRAKRVAEETLKSVRR
jgi:hypothetical protein